MAFHKRPLRQASCPRVTVTLLGLIVIGLLANGSLCSAQENDSAAKDPAPKDSASVAAESIEHQSTNRLIGETSPYLLQHAHNPVDWFPWGDDAFAKAKKENKAIFLSVGYSTCFWCHVMERESFEKDDVAKILNQHFVCIKIDREERPELDQQYMLATQLMSGRGGWPNSVWLTPEGKPWMAGTYFPREPFKKVLLQLADVWKNRNREVLVQANRLTAAIKQNSDAKLSQRPITNQLIKQSIDQITERYDAVEGGFGTAPKFPPHSDLTLLIDQYRRHNDRDHLMMVDRTLVAMSHGGVYDQLGGGFHRYSTDRQWMLPHFEKMLYDNGQLMRLYADGYLLTKRPSHRETVEGIYQWIRREMTSPEGGFYSAIDSESNAEEGAFYVWSHQEIIEVLGEQDGQLFAEFYNVSKHGNFKEEATGKPSDHNILHRSFSIESLADASGAEKSDADKIDANAIQLAGKLDTLRKTLLAVRQKREYPHLDDKVLAAWNGLMIEGLAYAGRTLDNQEYIDAAKRAADFLLEKMIADGRIKRTYRNGQAKLDGYLNDYAFVASGFLQLHDATGDPKYLETATELVDTVLDEFQDSVDGGFYFTAAVKPGEDSDFVIRSKDLSGGGNLPSANGVMAVILYDLSARTEDPNYAAAAERTLKGLSGFMWESTLNADNLIVAASEMLSRQGDAD